MQSGHFLERVQSTMVWDAYQNTTKTWSNVSLKRIELLEQRNEVHTVKLKKREREGEGGGENVPVWKVALTTIKFQLQRFK